jgi:tetratricopeptide (TPR) repeat protein
MTRTWRFAGAGLLGIALLSLATAPAARAVPQEQQKPGYTMAEYQDYIKCTQEKDPQLRVKCLEDFLAKHPEVSPQLKLPAQRLLYITYFNDLKNYGKAIEYVDKMLTSADKMDAGSKFEAYYIRTQAFFPIFNDKSPDARDQATKSHDAAIAGLKALGEVAKPDNLSVEDFAKAKTDPTALFNYTAGFTSAYLKDYAAAVDSYKAALAVKPTDTLTYFRLGVVYLTMEPPKYMEGFWALARSIALKNPSEAQVRTYLRGQLVRYQQRVTCEALTDAEVNEMIQLAANSAERPASYVVPSAADLTKATEPGSNFIEGLQAGGDKAKVTWLAVCGLEFPEVGGKVIEVSGDNPILLRVFYAPTPELVEAGTTANMEAKVEGQPEVKRIQPGDPVRFSGTLVSYDASPFMLHWDKTKVNPEDIPADKPQPGKTPTKRPPKKPGGRN